MAYNKPMVTSAAVRIALARLGPLPGAVWLWSRDLDEDSPATGTVTPSTEDDAAATGEGLNPQWVSSVWRLQP
jgi:hypothetical protein